jgi:GTPase SAR1 family protein
VPLILVGNKCDLTDRSIVLSEIKAKQNEFGCKYLECSAKTGTGINDVVLSLIYAVLKPVEEFVGKFKEELKEQMDSRRSSE